MTYQFDTAGRRTQLQVAGQTAVTYGYDNADRLQTITQGATVVGFGYDNADRRTLLTLPGSLTVAYGYDDASQLLSLTYKRSGTTIGDLAYTYDGSGRRATTSGSYARLNLPAALSSALYNANNQLTKWGTTNISYDLNGNMLGDGTNTYNWNARDQLSSVTKTGQTLPSFTYDAIGRRQKKTLGATVTSYLYDGANTVQELTGASVTANMLTGLGVDELFQRADGATTRTALSDALGGTLALADSAGVVQTSYTYAPYGDTTVTGTASNNTSQYTGRENDNDGLYFYRARYYHPVFGRFVSEDPLGFGAGSTELYQYALDGPTNFTDPTGEIVPWLAACASGAAFSVLWDVGGAVLSGRKVGIRSVAGSALQGCVGSLIGFGAGRLVGSLLSRGGFGLASGARSLPATLHYYTDLRTAAKIEASQLGLSGKTLYLTPQQGLSPLRAQIELALPMKNTGVAVFEVDAAGLQPSLVSKIGRVAGNVNGRGGGGSEVVYQGTVSLNFVRRVR